MESINREEVIANPQGFDLIVNNHVRQECNGPYKYDGQENGKHKWAKPNTNMKVYWHGSAWDIFWGGVSPEN